MKLFIVKVKTQNGDMIYPETYAESAADAICKINGLYRDRGITVVAVFEAVWDMEREVTK